MYFSILQLIVLDWDRDFHVAGEYFGDQCRYDYVEVQSQYRPENPGGEMQTWCGDYSPGMNQVLGPVMIRHVSDWANTADGWSLQWTAECKHLGLLGYICIFRNFVHYNYIQILTFKKYECRCTFAGPGPLSVNL